MLRLIRDVDDKEEGADNHEEMMKVLYELCQLKDDHNALTADDLLGKKLLYKGKYDYGAFTITASISRVDFGTSGTVKFFIEEQRAQVFGANVTGLMWKEKYRGHPA